MGATKEPALASAAMVEAAMVEGGAGVEGATTVGPAVGACRNLLWLVCASSPAPASFIWGPAVAEWRRTSE